MLRECLTFAGSLRYCSRQTAQKTQLAAQRPYYKNGLNALRAEPVQNGDGSPHISCKYSIRKPEYVEACIARDRIQHPFLVYITATEQQRLSLQEVRFVPCADPPHREVAPAGGASRLDMVKAAVADEPAFVVDDREFRRDGPSYSVDTLTDLRGEHPDAPLCLLMGMDSFLGLPSWYHWEARETTP